MIRNTDTKRDSKHLRHVTTAKQTKLLSVLSGGVLRRIRVETRWWAKDAALTKVFGKFGDPEGWLYIDLVITLKALSEKEADCACEGDYAEALLKYQTTLTAQTFLRIFQQTTPLSNYLQTSGMDLLTAHRFVTSTQDNLKKKKIYARDFKGVKTDSNRRICAMGQWRIKCVWDAEVENALPNRRPKKTKKMPGELCDDTTISDADSK